jgi:transcriptional regulator GlxA family with amidase domain
MKGTTRPYHVSIVAFPDAALSTLTGIYDVMNSFGMLAGVDDAIPDKPPFRVDIVGEERRPVTLAGGVPIEVRRSIDEIHSTDIVIVPSIVLGRRGWKTGRYPRIVEWVAAMYKKGAILCSACSGVFLLAESGLFDNHEATVHWGYAPDFQKTFPKVSLLPEQVLVVSGEREQFVSSGASMSWHDLVLYLIARHAGSTTAQTVARYFALQWHHEGLSPYIMFRGRTDHGDARIGNAQKWLSGHFSVARPVEEMIRRSGVPERTFKRRFTLATGLAPIDYVQRLRVDDAKRRLERTEAPIDEISWKVGYEDPAFFRCLFKRTTGLSPGAYRRKFRLPSYAQQSDAPPEPQAAARPTPRRSR